jgi:hypothetical protein
MSCSSIFLRLSDHDSHLLFVIWQCGHTTTSEIKPLLRQRSSWCTRAFTMGRARLCPLQHAPDRGHISRRWHQSALSQATPPDFIIFHNISAPFNDLKRQFFQHLSKCYHISTYVAEFRVFQHCCSFHVNNIFQFMSWLSKYVMSFHIYTYFISFNKCIVFHHS